MKSRSAIAALVLLAAGTIGYFGWRYFAVADRQAAQPARPPVYVAAAPAQSETWRSLLSAVGTLQAVHGVQLTTEVGGIVQSIHFESGQTVRQGSLLVQLNTEADRARLNNLLAQLQQARIDSARNRRLLEGGAVAEAEVEQSQTAVERLEAQVAEQRAIIAKKAIRAPFTGEIGIRMVDLGQFLSPGQGIASLQTIAPIYVNFALPEIHHSAVRRGLPIEARVDAYAGETFGGKISAVNPGIDQETRNFLLQGTLPNRRRRLRPGMFAEVTVIAAERRKVITVPATAISYNPYGNAVFRLEKRTKKKPQRAGEETYEQKDQGLFEIVAGFLRGGRAQGTAPNGETSESASAPPIYVAVRTFVVVGERRGTEVAIEKGVAPGDLVVTAGQLKLEDGAPVIIAEESKVPGLSPDFERP